MRLVVLLFLIPLALFTAPGHSDVVVPTERVSIGVHVRQRATSKSPIAGLLTPGQQFEYVGSVPGWYEVALPNGSHGFVSKSWTRVVAGGDSAGATLWAADVGTGLALLVQGRDFAMVYDGGSNDDLALGASDRFVAFLRAADPSLTTIDHLVLSHPHRDHVEYLADVLSSYEVNHVWDSGAVNPICGYRSFLRAVSTEPTASYHSAVLNFGTHTVSFAAQMCYGLALPAEGIRLVHGSRIDQEPIPLGEGATMTFLHADGTHHSSYNENSLVLRLDIGTAKVLIMGDAEAGGRQDPSDAPVDHSIEGILLDCCVADVKADVLVVGHHGSKTSSRTAFLDAVGAHVFIVSSGPTKYGSVVLPDQVVLDALKARGRVFRTDDDDSACAINDAKIGPDHDGKPGGCSNVKVTISPTGTLAPEEWSASD